MKRRLSAGPRPRQPPRLLLLDEPTTGLDPQARHLMWGGCNFAAAGTSILLTTHFMDEAERLCSRLLVLDHGKNRRRQAARLIAQHLESDVVEVFGVGAVALAEDANLRALAARESAARRCSSTPRTRSPVAGAGPASGHLRTLHRPCQPGRLFLKLTGRQIRE